MSENLTRSNHVIVNNNISDPVRKRVKTFHNNVLGMRRQHSDHTTHITRKKAGFPIRDVIPLTKDIYFKGGPLIM